MRKRKSSQLNPYAGWAVCIILLHCSCSRQNESKAAAIADKSAPSPANPESEILSKILEHEDSSFSYEWHKKGGMTVYAEKEIVPSGSHVFIAIYDKYLPAPNLGDTGFFYAKLSPYGADSALISNYSNNKDVSRFGYPLRSKHKYVFVDTDLFKKSHFSLKDLPKKYVSKYCRINISKPTLNGDSTASITYMENYCNYESSLFFLKKLDTGWVVAAKVENGYSHIAIP